MICLKCGKIIEFEYRRIEKLQQEAAKRHNFHPVSHKMELYGHCGECRKELKTTKMKKLNLTRMRSGTKGEVVKIGGRQHMKNKMETLGIRIGRKIEKVSGHAMRGPVVIKLGATQVAIGHGMAHKIIVEVDET
jgi:Fe2+ transport system protein FeoA